MAFSPHILNMNAYNRTVSFTIDENRAKQKRKMGIAPQSLDTSAYGKNGVLHALFIC
jgi:hypothetical protein